LIEAIADVRYVSSCPENSALACDEDISVASQFEMNHPPAPGYALPTANIDANAGV
jgi:hypothetical protein